jgi:predicted MFS family arabinose efflux permease
LNRFSSLGGAAGIAATVLWLLGANFLGPAEVTLRVLFVILGVVAILAALYYYHCLRYSLEKQPGSSQPFIYEGPMSTGQRVISFTSILPGRVHRPIFSDQLVYILALHFILSVGFGMSFSGVHSYFITELKVPVALVMGALLGYKLTSYAVSGPMGEGMAGLLPLQAVCLTSLLRVAALVTVALAGIVLPDGFALAAVLLAVTLWGISGGAMAVAAPANVIQLSVPHRWKQSIVLYLAVSNGGALIGAIVGGMLANTFGFAPLFLIAAVVSAVATVLMLRS